MFKYCDKTIISIEMNGNEKIIHFLGYSYYVENEPFPYRFVYYIFFYAPLTEVLDEGVSEYEIIESEFQKQSCTGMTEAEIKDVYDTYDNGEKPVELCKTALNINTPCGCYILM